MALFHLRDIVFQKRTKESNYSTYMCVCVCMSFSYCGYPMQKQEANTHIRPSFASPTATPSQGLISATTDPYPSMSAQKNAPTTHRNSTNYSAEESSTPTYHQHSNATGTYSQYYSGAGDNNTYGTSVGSTYGYAYQDQRSSLPPPTINGPYSGSNSSVPPSSHVSPHVHHSPHMYQYPSSTERSPQYHPYPSYSPSPQYAQSSSYAEGGYWASRPHIPHRGIIYYIYIIYYAHIWSSYQCNMSSYQLRKVLSRDFIFNCCCCCGE